MPAGIEIRAQHGDVLSALIAQARIPLGRACSGQGICRSCEITVLAGYSLLSRRTKRENHWRLESSQRLACQVAVVGTERQDQWIDLWSPAWGERPKGGP